MTHPWNVTPAEARAIQTELARQVEHQDRFAGPDYVAGVDVGFEDQGQTTRAAVVLLTYPELVPVAERLVRRPTTFPYVPGLLSFREIPAVLQALQLLPRQADIILCDGQGVAHPRRLGIASHLGVLLDQPTIGVAKTRLTGRYTRTPTARGEWVPLTEGAETLGAVLCTRAAVKPVFVSTGHRIALASALDIVLICAPRYRLPETTRRADRLASRRK